MLYWLVMLFFQGKSKGIFQGKSRGVFQGKSKGIKQHAVISSLLTEKAEVTTEVQIKIRKKNNETLQKMSSVDNSIAKPRVHLFKEKMKST